MLDFLPMEITNKESVAIMQGMPVFGGLRDEILGFLLERARVVNVPKAGYFMHENDPGDSMFILLSGRAAILKTWEGREYLLRYSAPGDCFGEMSLIDLGPRSVSARALEDSVALELAAADLHGVYRRDSKQFALIYMNMGREVSRRLRESNQRLFEARIEAGKVGEELHLP